MPTCPNCGEVIDETERFCFACGTRIDIDQPHESTTKCPRCGKAIKRNGACYCPQCGTALSSVVGETIPESADTGNQSKTETAPRNWILTGTIFLAAALVGLIFIFWFLRPSTPQDTAVAFLKAMQEGEYSRAYGYFDRNQLIGHPFLTEERFVKAAKNKPLRDFGLENPASPEIKGRKAKIQAVLDINGERREIGLVLINEGQEGNAEWRIDAAPFIRPVDISVVPGAAVYANGQPVHLENGRATLLMFDGDAAEFLIQHPDIKTVKKTIKAGEDLRVQTLRPAGVLEKRMQNTVQDFNTAWLHALLDLNIEWLNSCVKQDSDLWMNLRDQLDSMRYSGENVECKLVKQEFISAEIEENLDTVYYSVDETWDSVVKMADGTVVRQNRGQVFRYRYKIERQGNGVWLITGREEI